LLSEPALPAANSDELAVLMLRGSGRDDRAAHGCRRATSPSCRRGPSLLQDRVLPTVAAVAVAAANPTCWLRTNRVSRVALRIFYLHSNTAKSKINIALRRTTIGSCRGTHAILIARP
jgi:hypothetical protein